MAEETFLFYSDFNCPFCYALHERILAMDDIAKVQWRGIQHMPMASSQNPTLVDQTQLINEVTVVRKRAPEVPIVTPGYRPNTGLANEMVWALGAESSDRLQELIGLIHRAYWVQGQDISRKSVLKELCERAYLTFPENLSRLDTSDSLLQWQNEWNSEKFQSRIPAMISSRQNKPILGFPTFELISNFFAGTVLPVAPESLTTCEINQKQRVLLVGDGVRLRCNVLELEAGYEMVDMPTIEQARRWVAAQSCSADMIVIDQVAIGSEALGYCRELRREPEQRRTVLVVLLKEPDMEQELAAFDAGATDVMFDLSDAKVCQARLDMHLRMKRNTDLLASLATVDYLTELSNRREFDARLENEWQRSMRSNEPLSVILFDIDHFKLYNDTYGHAMGDDCLRQIATAMAQCLKRPADTLARYGGEEFVVLLPATESAGAQQVAASMIEAVRQLRLAHRRSPTADHVTISAGLATLVAQTDTALHTPTKLADSALYQAKRSGRDQLVVAQ